MGWSLLSEFALCILYYHIVRIYAFYFPLCSILRRKLRKFPIGMEGLFTVYGASGKQLPERFVNTRNTARQAEIVQAVTSIWDFPVQNRAPCTVLITPASRNTFAQVAATCRCLCFL